MLGIAKIQERPDTCTHDLSSLFRFSLLFNLSTRFLCIFSAIFSYLSFSSLAARLSLIRCMLLYQFHISAKPKILRFLVATYLSLIFLLILHLLLLGLHGGLCLSLDETLLKRAVACIRPKSRLVRMPILACVNSAEVQTG